MKYIFLLLIIGLSFTSCDKDSVNFEDANSEIVLDDFSKSSLNVEKPSDVKDLPQTRSTNLCSWTTTVNGFVTLYKVVNVGGIYYEQVSHNGGQSYFGIMIGKSGSLADAKALCLEKSNPPGNGEL